MKPDKQLITGTAFLLALAATVSAATFFGIGIASSNFVQNPANVLDADPDYATLEYATSITCPLGNFSKYSPAPNNFCVHNPSGQLIGGWEVITFSNTTGINITSIKVNASEFNLGCTTLCNSSVQVKVFRTGTSYNSNTVWTYVGQCSVPNDVAYKVCTFNTTVNGVGHVLIGRDGAGNGRPDPAVHWVTLNS